MLSENKLTERSGEATAGPNGGSLVRVRSLAEQHDLALAWCAASIGGVVAISLVPDERGLVRMLAPLAAMALFLGFGLTRSRSNTPRLADSIYFMGFLWTLWALIDVLVFSDQLGASALYNAFGYALIATASGMFMRLALLQFYKTTDDQEEQAVDVLDEYVGRLTAEIERTQRAVADLQIQGTLALHAWHRDFADAARTPVAALTLASEQITTESGRLAEALKDVRTSVTPIGRTIRTLETRIGGASDKLASATDQSSKALDVSLTSFQANLSRIERSPESLEARVQEVASSLERALAPLNQAASRILNETNAVLTGLAGAILRLPDDQALRDVAGKLAGELDTLRLRSAALATATESAATAITLASNEASSLASTLNSTRDDLNSGVTGATQHAQQLSGLIAEAGQSTKQVDQALKDVVAFVQTELSRR